MARFKRMEVLNTFLKTGVVPLFYHPDIEIVKRVVKAVYQGGARVFEFTNRGDFAHEVFAEVNKWAAQECPEIIMGAGSVVDAPTAALYIQLGANFIVSPSVNDEIGRLCNRRKIAWIPGCATLTEIHKAEELGSEIVKIFPGKQIGGADFVKAVLAPSPWTNIMPTGGVAPEKENIEQWIKAGACCVGLGSKLITNTIISNKDFNLLTEKVKSLVETVKLLM